MPGNDQTQPSNETTNPTKADANTKATEAAQLAEAAKRIRELEGKLTDANAKAAGLEGELSSAKEARDNATTRVTELTDEVTRLAAAAAEKGAPPKLDLPKNARQLSESATIGDCFKNRRDAKLGDVVIVPKALGDRLYAEKEAMPKGMAEKVMTEVAELQAKLGRQHRVFPVNGDMIEDLAQLKHLR